MLNKYENSIKSHAIKWAWSILICDFHTWLVLSWRHFSLHQLDVLHSYELNFTKTSWKIRSSSWTSWFICFWYAMSFSFSSVFLCLCIPFKWEINCGEDVQLGAHWFYCFQLSHKCESWFAHVRYYHTFDFFQIFHALFLTILGLILICGLSSLRTGEKWIKFNPSSNLPVRLEVCHYTLLLFY